MVTGGSCSASIDFPFFPLFFHPVTTFGALASFDAVHRRALNKLTCAVLADSAATLGTRPHSDRIALFRFTASMGPFPGRCTLFWMTILLIVVVDARKYKPCSKDADGANCYEA